MQNVPSISELFVELGTEDYEAAQKAENALIQLGGFAVPGLVEASQSPDPQVRWQAVWALGKIRDKRGLTAVIRATDDSDGRVAYDALMVLGRWNTPEALAILLRHVQQKTTDDSLPSAAASGLVQLGRAALPALHRAVLTAPPHAQELLAQVITHIHENEGRKQAAHRVRRKRRM